MARTGASSIGSYASYIFIWEEVAFVEFELAGGKIFGRVIVIVFLVGSGEGSGEGKGGREIV